MDLRGTTKPRFREPICKFSVDEDTKLRSLVARFGTSEWSRIAREITGRSARQCRERWQNYLRPDINNAAWTKEEEDLLVAKYSEYGPCWRVIASFFHSRTDINVKNYWNRRQRRLQTQSLHESQEVPDGSEFWLLRCSDVVEADPWVSFFL
jgi:hypothetical protein